MTATGSSYQAWLTKARNDLLNIENNLRSETIPWDTVCYHAQQAAEKALKAYLLFHRTPIPRTHDLLSLLARCVEHDSSLSALEDACISLNAYATGSRYPTDTFEPDETMGRGAYSTACTVYDAITLRLPRS